MLKQLAEEGVRSLAIFGLAKNAGKTTVLNALTQEAEDVGLPLGVLSVGVDGEERDVWSLKEKPAVRVTAGTLVATASSLLDFQAGGWELLESLPFHSPLGRVTVARALRPAKVKLAGVTRLEAVREVNRCFRLRGVRLTLIDGAYDRKAAAEPGISDASISVAGAGMAKTLEGVVRKVETFIGIFTLPDSGEDETLREAGLTALREGRLAGVCEGKVETLPFSSLLLRSDDWEELIGRGAWTVLAIPGSLTDATLERIAAASPLTLLLPDPTRCFASLSAVRRYYRQGGEIRYLSPVRLAAVAVNPVSPEGHAFDPSELKERVSEVCNPIPVVDVLRDDLTAHSPFRKGKTGNSGEPAAGGELSVDG
ncbi:hypothetical protein [Paludifilum halophilum]|uniref:Uncharacterized protein n=1 Tax=Paludifilum halophilum TaxID=1642702 RepID=A0A235B6P6_9BACL|nr:hypothetical protein [Paludifilum halophilum]OYD07966.1 hypothetical protein CHM34_07550 [Paludifilum halophilum]